MKAAILLAGVALLLAGCVTDQQQRIAAGFARAGAINEQCRAQLPGGELAGAAGLGHPGAAAALARCSTQGMRAAVAKAGYPYMDLYDVWLARRMVLAERLDAGEITKAQATLEMQEASVTLNEQARRRDLAAQTRSQATLDSTGQDWHGRIDCTTIYSGISADVTCY